MGISGLIPFLEKASSSVNIKQLEGSSVAIDSYCWLHKGVFACAEKLVRGESTDVHIQYCLKYVDMLLRYKIRVIMVFDGRHLPAKANTERRRRIARDESKRLAKEYLRKNEVEKARSQMRRAVDVTHKMALELIKACRHRGIDCIVAPYEADAQMAWLNKQGLVEYVVTEDSDLTLFGALKILFKLDLTGQALLVENTKFHLAMGCKPEKYTFDKFRCMCILSGCDYLDSLQGIGLKKARKFILTTEEEDMKKALKKMPRYLDMKQLHVTDEYIESFLRADATFKHMYIYNPLNRRMERLNEIDELQTDKCYCSNAGALLNNSDQAFQLAIGNLDPFTLKQLDDWTPNRNWKQVNSIWQNSREYQSIEEPSKSKRPKNGTGSIFHLKKNEFKNMANTEIVEKLSEERNKLEESEIFSIYKHASPNTERKHKRRLSSSSSCEENETNFHLGQPSKKYSFNPFGKAHTLENTKMPTICTNNSLLKLLSPKKANEENYSQQKIGPKHISVKSRFFAENIKQIVNNRFFARDLTSEMLKIEKKSNSYIAQQEDLYQCTLKSLTNDVEEKEPPFDNNNQYKEVENEEKSSTSDIETINVSQERFSNLKQEIILISDIEEEQHPQKSSMLSSTQTFTAISHKSKAIGLKTQNNQQSSHRKSANTINKQSKLSMFGFQKKPSLKKL